MTQAEPFTSFLTNLKTKIINFNQTDGITMSDFITNLDPQKSFIVAGRTQSSAVLIKVEDYSLKNS